MDFEWDKLKNLANIRKHKVSFTEAKSVFYDPNARVIDDPYHSEQEERFIIIGISESLHILTVCHCIRDEDTIRIISARKATAKEINTYNNFI